jgi:hypothetical protein
MATHIARFTSTRIGERSPWTKGCELQLKRGRERWNDPPYLARIIFSEMIHDDVDGLTGYGIAPYAMDDEFPTIEVDLDNCTVDGVPFAEFIAGAHEASVEYQRLLN